MALYRIHFWHMIKDDVLRDKSKNKYRELSEEEKNVKREYGRKIYHNVFEEKKQRLK